MLGKNNINIPNINIIIPPIKFEYFEILLLTAFIFKVEAAIKKTMKSSIKKKITYKIVYNICANVETSLIARMFENSSGIPAEQASSIKLTIIAIRMIPPSAIKILFSLNHPFKIHILMI